MADPDELHEPTEAHRRDRERRAEQHEKDGLGVIHGWTGVLEDGKRARSEVGTVQGGSVSPLLADVDLHYVFDLWVQRWRKKRAQGDMIVVASRTTVRHDGAGGRLVRPRQVRTWETNFR